MKKLPSLNGLRALSIIIVILFHLLPYDFNTDPSIMVLIPFLNGRFGVNIFFVISGFLITTLLMNEEKRTGSNSLKGFFLRRSLRILPAYYFLLFAYLIL